MPDAPDVRRSGGVDQDPGLDVATLDQRRKAHRVTRQRTGDDHQERCHTTRREAPQAQSLALVSVVSNHVAQLVYCATDLDARRAKLRAFVTSGATMRLTVRVFGFDIIEIEQTSGDDDDSTSPPFGFHGSGSGICELSDERLLDTSDATRS
jgi:hypothetical protein